MPQVTIELEGEAYFKIQRMLRDKTIHKRKRIRKKIVKRMINQWIREALDQYNETEE